MRRSAFASDLVDLLRECMGDICRQYVFARTRGVPPADCNSVTVSGGRRTTSYFEDCPPAEQCGEWDATHAFRITLTRICAGPDAAGQFDWPREDSEAACFHDHLELLESCLQCSDLSQLRVDHGIISIDVVDTEEDVESSGGGYSAYITLQVVAHECCPPPAPPEE